MTLLRSLLGASVSTDLASLPAGGTPSNAFVLPALNTAGAAVQMPLSSLLSWVQGHYPDLSTTTARVILAANAPLDASVHNRRLIVATPGTGTTVTLSPPAVFANLGTNFYCDLINYGPGVLAFGAGIKTSYSTLAVGQSARIVAFTLADGVTGVIEALFSAPLNTTPAITLTGPSSVPAVPSGASTVSVPITVATMNFSGTPTIQYSLDGAAYAALPSGATTTSTAVTGLAFALAGGSHTLLLKDTGTGTVSNTLTLTVESETLAGVPTSGWVVGTAKVLAGATTVLAGVSTAYAVLWNGSAEVGSRQAFTSSATLAALSFTPATANTSSTIRAFDAATGGNLLAESPALTVTAAATAAIVAPAYSKSLSDPHTTLGIWDVYPCDTSSSVINGALPVGIWAVLSGTTTNAQLTAVAVGWNPTATGTAAGAKYKASNSVGNHSDSSIAVTFTPNNNVVWDVYTYGPAQLAQQAGSSVAAGTQYYCVFDLTDGTHSGTMYVGPYTVNS